MITFYTISIIVIIIAQVFDYPLDSFSGLILGCIILGITYFIFQLQENCISWLCKKSPRFDKIYASYKAKERGIALLATLAFLIIFITAMMF